MKKVLILTVILIAIVIAGVISQKYFNSSLFEVFKTPKVIINNHTFTLYVAKNPKDKEIGLSKYKSIDKDRGMLFPFEKPDYYPFWMKEMKFPIDIIFILDNHIVTIYKNVQPPTAKNESLPIFSPQAPTDKVLEINADLTQKYNFRQGDIVKFENL